MPDTFFKTIGEKYLARCNNPSMQKKDWHTIVAEGFTPALTAESERRPNILLARESGDMGLALLWIVQAALIRPLLEDLAANPDITDQQHKIITPVTPEMCGALAHSDPPDNRLTVTSSGDMLLLNGVKKYITGGPNADFIFLTGRQPEDEKPSMLLWLTQKSIKQGELEILDMQSLCTSSHGRLTFLNKKIPASCKLSIRPSHLRRMLAIWGIVERTLIMETFLALLQYIRDRSGIRNNDKFAYEVMSQQQEATNQVIREAYAGERVHFPLDTLEKINHIAETTIPAASASKNISKDMLPRIEDATFIWNFWRGR